MPANPNFPTTRMRMGKRIQKSRRPQGQFCSITIGMKTISAPALSAASIEELLQTIRIHHLSCVCRSECHQCWATKWFGHSPVSKTEHLLLSRPLAKECGLCLRMETQAVRFGWGLGLATNNQNPF